MPISSLGPVRRPLFWLGCCFLGSMAAFFVLPARAALPCAGALALCFCWLSQGSARRFLPCLLLAAALGWGALLVHTAVWGVRLFPLIEGGRPVTVTMTVREAVQRGAYRRFAGRALIGEDGKTATAEAVITGFTEETFAPGETLRCEAFCPEVPAARRLPTGPIPLRITRLLPGDPLDSPQPLLARLLRWRALLSRRIAALAPGESGAVLAAMLVGDRSRLPADLTAAFRRSGLSHLLVVSGLHLVILNRMLSLALAPVRRERLRAALLIAFSWGFALLTGAGSSVVRAAVMLTLAQGAPLLNRRGDTLTSLAAAGVLMALQNPAALLGASFQLSFGAVAGLALLGGPIERALAGERPGPVRKRLAADLSAGLAAQAGAAPALLYTFGLFPLLGIAANLLVVGLIAPLMTLGLAALLLSFLLPAAAALLLPACRGLALALIAVARLFASLPFSQVGISFWWQAVGLLGLFLLAAPLLARRPGKGLVRAALLGWCAVFLTASAASALLSRSCAEILTTEGGCAVVSRGARAVVLGSPADIWEADALADGLTRLGVRRIDALLLSDGEHAGLPVVRLLDRFEGPRRVAAPDSPALRRFCDAAGLIPCAPPREAVLFGAVRLTREADGWRAAFSGATLLKSGAKCAIIGSYGRACPLGEQIAHIRVRLEETDDSAK